LLQDTGETWYPDLEKTLRLLIEAEKKLQGHAQQKLQAVSDRFTGVI